MDAARSQSVSLSPQPKGRRTPNGINRSGPITMLNAQASGMVPADAVNPDAIAENDTFNEGSGDGDTV